MKNLQVLQQVRLQKKNFLKIEQPVENETLAQCTIVLFSRILLYNSMKIFFLFFFSFSVQYYSK